jgi:hypothetical protein
MRQTTAKIDAHSHTQARHQPAARALDGEQIEGEGEGEGSDKRFAASFY